MKAIVFAAALFVSAGTAIAGSDHYGSGGDQQPASPPDSRHTASTKKADGNVGVPQTMHKSIYPDADYGQGIWGH